MMQYLGNTYDPKHNDAPRVVTRNIGETQSEAWANKLKWLEGKVIGLPEATAHYTQAELIEQNMVGVYSKDGE